MRRLAVLLALLLITMRVLADSSVLDAGVLVGAAVVLAGGLLAIAFLRHGRRTASADAASVAEPIGSRSKPD